MLIGEFTRVTGLSRDTVRFYVRRGLLQPVIGAGGTNRYQVFDADQVERALIIRNAQALGFTLREIASLNLEYAQQGMTARRKQQLMVERVAMIDAQMTTLRSMRRYLIRKAAWIGAGEQGAPPAYRAVAARGAAINLPAACAVRRPAERRQTA